MIQYARSFPTPEESARVTGLRCKPRDLQHIVKDREVDNTAKVTSVGNPWVWKVTSRCGQEMRRAAVKDVPFLDLTVCAECKAA